MNLFFCYWHAHGHLTFIYPKLMEGRTSLYTYLSLSCNLVFLFQLDIILTFPLQYSVSYYYFLFHVKIYTVYISSIVYPTMAHSFKLFYTSTKSMRICYFGGKLWWNNKTSFPTSSFSVLKAKPKSLSIVYKLWKQYPKFSITHQSISVTFLLNQFTKGVKVKLNGFLQK